MRADLGEPDLLHVEKENNFALFSLREELAATLVREKQHRQQPDYAAAQEETIQHLRKSAESKKQEAAKLETAISRKEIEMEKIRDQIARIMEKITEEEQSSQESENEKELDLGDREADWKQDTESLNQTIAKTTLKKANATHSKRKKRTLPSRLKKFSNSGNELDCDTSSLSNSNSRMFEELVDETFGKVYEKGTIISPVVEDTELTVRLEKTKQATHVMKDRKHRLLEQLHQVFDDND